MVLTFLKDRQEVCHALEAFCRGCILLVRNDNFSSYNCCSYKLFFRVTEFAHFLRMFLRFYTHFKNLLIKRNDIPHVLTSINQEVFFDQSQFISVVFVSILFSVFLLPLFLGILLYLILSPVSIFCTEIIIAQRKRAEPYSLCHSLFPA